MYLTNRNPRMAGMGEVTEPSTMDSITSTLRDLVTVYNQQRILDANIERASRGLPPLNTAQIAPTYNVGLAPDTRNMLLIGGGLLLAVLVLGRSKS